MIFLKAPRVKTAALFAAILLVVLFSSCKGKAGGFGAGRDVYERMRNTTYEVKFNFPGLERQPDHDMVIRAFNDKLTEMGYPGLSIRLDSSDWASWMDRSSALVLSGGDYDLVYAPIMTPFYADAMAGGAWLPWDSYIDLVPEFAELLAPWREYLYVWGADTKEKHIYRIPNIKEYASYRCEARWNKNVAERLGITEQLRNIKNVYEFEPYLEMYKNVYGNNGMAVLAVDSYKLVDCFMLGAFNSFLDSVYDVNTDSYLNYAFSPWFDEYIALTRSWYAKGYIPAYQQTELIDDLSMKFGPESFLVYFNEGKPGGEAEMNQNAKGRYEMGTTYLTPAFVDFNSLMGVAWGLNARSKNPEAAAFLFGLLSSNKELTNLINFGIEGVHYNLDSNGVAVRTVPSQYYSNLLWMLGNRFLCHRLPGEPENLSELYQEFNNNAVKFPNFGFQEPGEEAWKGVDRDMYKGVLGALRTQYQRSIEIGTLSDADLADIRRRLTQANYQQIDAVLNREYAAYKGSNEN